jgi:predicted dehydrogenase
MENRRTFLKASAATAALSRSVLGANDRIQMGLIGCGTRGGMVSGFFGRHEDCVFIAACDVAKGRLDQSVTRLGEQGRGIKVDAYGDYRRILERKDIDAVLVTTPDHWHSPITVDACAAGKDVYVEKPISNTIEAGRKMVQAARQYNRVVQMGVQQRQGEAFKEGAKLVQEGLLGKVTHVVLQYEGGYARTPEPNQDPPADLDWDMFQGPAPRRPYRPSRQRSWRAYYDYGGGLVTDWGVHLADVAHMYMKKDLGAPLLTSAMAQNINVQDPQHEEIPEAFVINWQYDDFVMSFTNAVLPNPDFPLHGTYFFGPRGCLMVNRAGYIVRPNVRRMPPPNAQAGRAGAPGGAPGALQGGRGMDLGPPIEARVRPFAENYTNDPDTIAHARNFLDCVKSRQKPVGDIEIGFHSSLPCLLGVVAIQQGRTIAWDGNAAKPV